MTSTLLAPKVYRPGDTAVLPGEYIECDANGWITLHPRILVVDVREGEQFPEGTEHWIRYGRI